MDPILQLILAQIPLLALMAAYFFATRNRSSNGRARLRSKKTGQERKDTAMEAFGAKVEASLGVMRGEIKGQKKELKALKSDLEALQETLAAQHRDAEQLRAEMAEMLNAIEGAVQTARQSAGTAQRIEEMTRQFMKQRAAAKEIENVLSPRNKRPSDGRDAARPPDGPAQAEPPKEHPRPAPVVNIKQRAHGLFGTSAERGRFGSSGS